MEISNLDLFLIIISFITLGFTVFNYYTIGINAKMILRLITLMNQDTKISIKTKDCVEGNLKLIGALIERVKELEDLTGVDRFVPDQIEKDYKEEMN